MTIDLSRLPRRPAVDTCALTLLRPGETSHEAAVFRAFWAAMKATGGTILVPAPVLIEFLRKPPHLPRPKEDGVEVVALDERVGEAFTERILRAAPHLAKGVRVKYDTLILATALRHRADCLVTADEALAALATKVGLRACPPSAFEGQIDLPLEPPSK